MMLLFLKKICSYGICVGFFFFKLGHKFQSAGNFLVCNQCGMRCTQFKSTVKKQGKSHPSFACALLKTG